MLISCSAMSSSTSTDLLASSTCWAHKPFGLRAVVSLG